ncbi:MAG: hypothetical protein JST00_10600 [Deltaproteobacteria bacterium]|nr:hypothetical protein [Deltaproteobacteria bacterium]
MASRWLLPTLAALVFGLGACTSSTSPPVESADGDVRAEDAESSDDEQKPEESSNDVRVTVPATTIEPARNTPWFVSM